MTANVTCLASGWPLPTISWYLNGQPVAPGSQSTEGLEVRGVLSINQGGMYDCVALSNGRIKTATLNVVEKGQ